MKKIMVMAVGIAVLLVGCAHTVTVKGWVKDGSSVEQLREDYHKCMGPRYVKDGMTEEEYERDWEFCDRAVEARHKRSQDVAWATGIPSLIIDRTTRGLRQRCFESKGYREGPPRSEEEINLCMQKKGYEWR